MRGRLLWLVRGARAVVAVDQLQPIRWRAHFAPSVLFGGEGTENRQIWVLGGASWGNWGLGRKSAGFLYGWASEDGVWAGYVWGVGGMRALVWANLHL